MQHISFCFEDVLKITWMVKRSLSWAFYDMFHYLEKLTQTFGTSYQSTPTKWVISVSCFFPLFCDKYLVSFLVLRNSGIQRIRLRNRCNQRSTFCCNKQHIFLNLFFLKFIGICYSYFLVYFYFKWHEKVTCPFKFSS